MEIPAAPMRLRQLVAEHADDRPLQAGIGWPRERWRHWLPEHAALFDGLDDSVGRHDIRRLAGALDDSPEGAEALFVASMVWGFGRVGYGPYRTQRILTATANAREKLCRVRRRLKEASPVEAYRLLASAKDCRLRWLGPAFGTKYLHFASPVGAPLQGLILDRIVASWLTRYAGWSPSPWAWRPQTYERYLLTMHDWADTIGTSADRLETLMFLDELPPDSQWAPEPR